VNLSNNLFLKNLEPWRDRKGYVYLCSYTSVLQNRDEDSGKGMGYRPLSLDRKVFFHEPAPAPGISPIFVMFFTLTTAILSGDWITEER
jgi:hypothetical protein